MVKLYAIRRRGGWESGGALLICSAETGHPRVLIEDDYRLTDLRTAEGDRDRIERVEVAGPVSVVARGELAWSDQR